MSVVRSGVDEILLPPLIISFFGGGKGSRKFGPFEKINFENSEFTNGSRIITGGDMCRTKIATVEIHDGNIFYVLPDEY